MHIGAAFSVNLELHHWDGQRCAHQTHGPRENAQSSDLSRYPWEMMRGPGLSAAIAKRCSSHLQGDKIHPAPTPPSTPPKKSRRMRSTTPAKRLAQGHKPMAAFSTSLSRHRGARLPCLQAPLDLRVRRLNKLCRLVTDVWWNPLPRTSTFGTLCSRSNWHSRLGRFGMAVVNPLPPFRPRTS